MAKLIYLAELHDAEPVGVWLLNLTGEELEGVRRACEVTEHVKDKWQPSIRRVLLAIKEIKDG